MTKSINTLSPERQAILDEARSQNKRAFTPRIPELRLTNKEMETVPSGEYYLQEYDSVERKKIITPIGANPEIVILRKATTYSYYSDKLERLVAWTSDIYGYSEYDDIVLFKNDGATQFIEFKGSYPEFKAYSLKHYTITNPVEDRTEKLLSFKTVLYVLYEKKVYRMFVTNTGVAGVAAGEKRPAFGNPQPLSLTHFLDSVSDSSSGERSAACCESICKLGSVFVDDTTIPYYMMQFTEATKKPDIEFVLDMYAQLKTDLQVLLAEDIKRMTSPNKVAVEITPPYAIDPSSLPF